MPYLISYLAAGIILGTGVLLNGRVKKGRLLVAFLVTVVLWPLIALFAPDMFFSPRSDEFSQLKQSDALQENLSVVLKRSGELSGTLMDSLSRTEKQGEKSVAYFSLPRETSDILEEFWQSNIPPAALHAVRSARYALEEHAYGQLDSLAMFSRAEPDWLIGFSNEFLKSISHTDAKLRGRILDAVGKISAAPMNPLGDTVKPLSADLSGMWRYRIGDHRLLYLPDKASKKITLLYFGARGDVYAKI